MHFWKKHATPQTGSMCVCETLWSKGVFFQSFAFLCRGLAAYSVMPANEASGIGGWSYGRIALYLQEVDRTLIHQKSRALFFFLEQVFRNPTCQSDCSGT